MQFTKFAPLFALFVSAAMAGPIASEQFDSSEIQSLENGILKISAIPAGAKIEQLGESSVNEDASGTFTANPAIVARELLKRHDCKGSDHCSKVSSIACRNAINEFGADTWFCGNRRRFDNNGGPCLAIFEPHTNDICIVGWKIRELFLNIYNVQGCGKCGRWFDANATFRLDYCQTNCREI